MLYRENNGSRVWHGFRDCSTGPLRRNTMHRLYRYDEKRTLLTFMKIPPKCRGFLPGCNVLPNPGKES